MTPDLVKMQEQIDALEAFVLQLQQSNLIPRAVETAFSERLGSLGATGTGSAGTTSSFSGFPVIVPANPSGVVNVVIKGVTYGLLYK